MASHDVPTSRVSLFLVAYEKQGEPCWCDSAMDRKEATAMVELLERSGTRAEMLAVEIRGNLLDENDEPRVHLKTANHRIA